jgi:uridylate kinase
MQKDPIIISVGGSLIIPDSVNTNFLEKLVFFLKEEIKKGERFILVTGGGKTARKYQEGVKHFFPESTTDADWIGIHSTILNANLLKIILKGLAYEKIVQDPTIKYEWNTPILIGAGYEPGHSTDYDAVCLANTYGVKKIINLSNIDYAYDSDPKVNPDAKILKNISWDEFFKIIPKDWSPGLNSPFDPTASRLAKLSDIEVSIINGSNLERISDYLSEKSFIGTLIKG